MTALLLALVSLSWSGLLERDTDARLSLTLERALVTAALARGLNGAISVAQGTEIAFQPIGVGVTITAGQILDPLNDLVERFSWLALVASASLGTQLLLTEIAAEPVVSMMLSSVVGLYLLFLWWPGQRPAGRTLLMRILGLALLARFLFTLVGLSVAWVDTWVLEARQQSAMIELTQARDDIQSLQTEAPPLEPTESSLRERFDSLIDGGWQLLNLDAQLDALQARTEAAISHLLELTVLFLVQTLLVPIAAFWLALGAFRWFWDWARRS